MKNIIRKRVTAASSSTSLTRNIDDDLLDFIMSTDDEDRYGDVIDVDGWDYDEFEDNSIALLNHDQNFPIGRWYDIGKKVIKGRKVLGAKLKLAPEGTSKRIDEVRKLVAAGILRSCSVGFLPLESVPRKNGGTRYKRAKLVECSVVSIPANSNALLQEAKSLGVSDEMIRKIFLRPPTNASLAERDAHRKAVLARSRAVMAKSKPTSSPSRVNKSSDPIGDLYDRLTPEQIARLEVARMKREANEVAHYKSNAFDDTPPSTTFCGQPMFKKKNEFGW
jgi:HK97 family phage prohead protease